MGGCYSAEIPAAQRSWPESHQLVQGIATGDLRRIKQLVNKNNTQIQFEYALTAAHQGQLKILQWLLAHQQDSNPTGNQPTVADTPTLTDENNASSSGEKDNKVRISPLSSMTPLLFASGRGHLEVVQWLIDQEGASPDQKTPHGNTPLLLAAGHGHLNVVQWLINTKGVSSTAAVSTHTGCNCLLAAVSNGHLPVVQWLLSPSPENRSTCSLQDTDNSGNDPLLLAVMRGHLPVVKWLLEQHAGKGSTWWTTKNKSGLSAIVLAAQHSHTEIVKHLATHGLPARCLTQDCEPNTGNTALLIAAATGNLEMLKFLFALKPTKQKQGRPQTPLLAALAEASPTLADEDERNSDGHSALLVATVHGQLAVIEWLIKSELYDVKQEQGSINGENALTLAAAHNRLEVLKWLVTQGNVNPVTQVDGSNVTAIVAAAVNGHVEIVSWLATSNPGEGMLSTGNGNEGPLLASARSGQLAVVQWLVEKGGSNPAADQTAEGCTALGLAAEKGHAAIVEWLLGNCTHQWSDVDHVLGCAAERDWVNIVDTILQGMDDTEQELSVGQLLLRQKNGVPVGEGLMKLCGSRGWLATGPMWSVTTHCDFPTHFQLYVALLLWIWRKLERTSHAWRNILFLSLSTLPQHAFHAHAS
eukprot:TRINITY_DN21031_c0_g1_i1.p1 TRINITY_DN21031_c0_g1~~TRINITY_DN21031_c0_g1_i1.p1  ORF type:complete len:643 (-),score=36.59 TRINITY_DN21031_c0_g1_i1:1381-3309(-)